MNDVQTLLISLTTVCTAMMIGLGFLPQPSRESAIWSIAFIAVMVSTYFGAAADAFGDVWTRAIGEGLNIAAVGPLWGGGGRRLGGRRGVLGPNGNPPTGFPPPPPPAPRHAPGTSACSLRAPVWSPPPPRYAARAPPRGAAAVRGGAPPAAAARSPGRRPATAPA